MFEGLPGSALAIVLLLLPGAFATWAYQRNAPRYGSRLRDWVLRLIGISMLIATVGSWPLYWLYSNYWAELQAGSNLPKQLAIVPFVYVGLPTLLGWLYGLGIRHRWKVVHLLAGDRRAPRAWDHLFGSGKSGTVRVKLKSGVWIGGAYEQSAPISSYAAYDGPNQDIYLSRLLTLEPRSGEVVRFGGKPIWLRDGMLIEWSEVEYLIFTPASSQESKNTRNKGQ